MKTLIRVTTVPQSLKSLLKGQLKFMSKYYKVLAVSAPGTAIGEIKKYEGVGTIPINMTRKISPLSDIKAIYLLYKLFKKENPFIVHTHTPKAGLVGMIAARLARVPCRLHTVAGLPLMETNGLKRQILNMVEILTYYCATRVYPNSNGLYNFILSSKFCNKNKLKVIGNGSSNGINTDFYSRSNYPPSINLDLKSNLGIRVHDFVFIYVGRLVSHKGINELITAFLKIAEEFASVRLLLVGPFESHLDPLNRETIELIESHPRIISTGYVLDVRPYFAIADVLAFPSYREGFPNVVMQAGAMDLPCIVTDINGCNEIIKHNVNGLVINKKNDLELYDAMKRILMDERLRIMLQKNARSMIEKRYSQAIIWQQILTEYQSFESQLLNDLC